MRSSPALLTITALALAACAPPPEPVAPAADTAAPAASAAPAAAGPTTLRGTLAGGSFAPVAACITQFREDGRAQIEIVQAVGFDVAASCGRLPASPEHRLLGLEIPWQAGARLDVSTHRVASGVPAGYVVFWNKDGSFRRLIVNQDIKPSGAVEVLRAGGRKGDVGRVRVSFVSGAERVEGEIDVYVSRDAPSPR